MKHFFIFFLILLAKKELAQESYGGVPYTYRINSVNAAAPNYRQISNNIPTTSLPFFDNANLKLIADSINGNCVDCKNSYYGKTLNYAIDIIANATYEIVDSMKIWRYTFSSSSAEGLQFYFSKFKIPDGGELYFYDSKKTFLFGNFNEQNNPIDSTAQTQFATVPLFGDSIVLEYNQLIDIVDIPILELKSVVHVFDNKLFDSGNNQRTQSGACQVDVNCADGYGWESERNSVVLILFNDGGWTGWCSGNMINTTLNNESPYLLTAGHCIKDDGNYIVDPASLLFLFNHQTYCNGSPVTYNTLFSVFSSFDLSTKNNLYYDYSLLQINASAQTLRNWSVCYAGWDRKTSISSFDMPLTMIHHPDGDVKKISISKPNLPLADVYYASDPSPVFDNSKPQYLIYWADNKGMSEGGSSGAPIFSYNHRIVGIASTGKFDDCNTLYRRTGASKFYSSWNDGDLGFWLDPTNSNAQFVPTYCPASNSDPTGTGLGGTNSSCNPKTVVFSVNGHNSFTSPQIGVTNVCKNDVWISPYSGCPANYSPNTIWSYKKKTSSTWCNKISDRSKAAYEAKYFFGLKCNCTFYQLFFSIQECDQNLNLIGPEYTEWKYIYDGDKSSTAEYLAFQTFNFNGSYSPLGFALQDGKYYKLKLATISIAWWSYSAYIKTFTPTNNIIQNKVLTWNEIGTDVTLINTTIPFSAGLIKVAAENSIKIQPNSKLQTGRYFIQDIDCNNINQFRMNNNDTVKSKSQETQPAPFIKNNSVENNFNEKSTFSRIETSIEIAPNPSSMFSNLKFNLSEKSIISASLYDMNGRKIFDLLSNASFEKGNIEATINSQDLVNGIYLIKTYINSKLYVNKLIVSHD